MRVTNSASYEQLTNQLQIALSRQNTLQNQVSTGQRITNPSDDAAAYGRVMNNTADLGLVQQYYRNAQTGLGINEASSTSVSSIKDLSDRAGEIAQLSTGTASADSMKSYGIEVNQLMEQALQDANGKLNGSFLFGGTKSDAAPFTASRDASGNITGVTYNGSASGAQISVDGGTSVSPYTSGTQNQGFATFINNLGKLRDALNSGDTSAVSATQADLTASSDDLVDTAGALGAVNSRLTAASASASARFNSISGQISTDVQADLATTTIKLEQAQTAYQASLQTGAKILSESLLDYIH